MNNLLSPYYCTIIFIKDENVRSLEGSFILIWMGLITANTSACDGSNQPPFQKVATNWNKRNDDRLTSRIHFGSHDRIIFRLPILWHVSLSLIYRSTQITSQSFLLGVVLELHYNYSLVWLGVS